MSGALFIPAGVLGLTQKIVNGHVIVVGEADHYIGGNIPLAQFIITVDLLRTI